MGTMQLQINEEKRISEIQKRFWKSSRGLWQKLFTKNGIEVLVKKETPKVEEKKILLREKEICNLLKDEKTLKEVRIYPSSTSTIRVEHTTPKKAILYIPSL